MECHQFIEDQRTGDIVCTLCGLVDGHIFLSNCTSFDEADVRRDVVSEIILNICELVHIGEEVALQVYNESNLKHTWGQKEALAAACVYLACRMENVPRTVKEIANAVSIKATCVHSFIRQLSEGRTFPRIEPSHFLTRFCSRLGLSGDESAKHVLRSVEDSVTGRAPETIAAIATLLVHRNMIGRDPDAVFFKKATTVALSTVKGILKEHRNLHPKSRKRRQ